MRRRLALLAAVVLLAAAAGPARAGLPPVRSGDIVFHSSRSTQSLAIQRATGSRYSHMGVVLFRGRDPYVLEAVATVRFTPLARWIARGEGGRFVARRLRSPLTPTQVERLQAAARLFLGRPYDLTFEWSDRRLYCSELVWKLYQGALGIRIGKLQRLRDFHLSDPHVRAKLRERYGSAVPLDEPVISPAAMLASPLLVEVPEGAR